MSYNTGTQSSGCLTYLIYKALKEPVFLHCNIGIFSKYYATGLSDCPLYTYITKKEITLVISFLYTLRG